MESLRFSAILVCLLVAATLLTCTQSTESGGTEVSVSDIWLDDLLDNDNDYYYCDGTFNFSLTSNKADVSVVIEIGIRPASTNPNDPYQICFESTALSIGSTKSGQWYLHLHDMDATITQGYYDFQLKVYLNSQGGEPLTTVSPTNFTEMGHVPLEPASADPVEGWVSWLDDEVFESSFTYYPRYPTGATYTTLAEQFVKPLAANELTVENIRVYIPTLYTASPWMSLSIYSDQSNQPNTVLYETNFILYTIGWNEFPISRDLSANDVFYIGVSTSINYAVGVDSSSTALHGYALRYATGNPPTYTWYQQQRNFGIEIYVSYTVDLNAAGKVTGETDKNVVIRRKSD
jgi:hypothetical protein